MGTFVPKFSQGAGAPEVKDGLHLLRFDGMDVVEHEDWAVERNKFGKPDDGRRVHFYFTLLNKKGEVVYAEGDPVELENNNARPEATGERSTFYALYSGICTPAELEAFKGNTLTEEQAAAQVGRVVHGKVEHTEKGWPFVSQVIGIAEED